MKIGQQDDGTLAKIYEILAKDYQMEDGAQVAILLAVRKFLDVIAPFRKQHETK